MLVYDIRKYNTKNKKTVAKLSYDSNTDEFGIDIDKNVKKEELPLYLAIRASQGVYRLSDKDSRKWLMGRLTSPHRQNIGSILKSMNLMQYDENAFLQRNMGRCTQDDFEVVRC